MMYKFGQHDIKFLVVCVKYHMKTDVLITPLLWYKRVRLTFLTRIWQLGDYNKGQPAITASSHYFYHINRILILFIFWQKKFTLAGTVFLLDAALRSKDLEVRLSVLQ